MEAVKTIQFNRIISAPVISIIKSSINVKKMLIIIELVLKSELVSELVWRQVDDDVRAPDPRLRLILPELPPPIGCPLR